jgi:hypothetical protein
MKIDSALVGTTTITASSLSSGDAPDWENADITHNLGYPPFFMGFISSDIRNPTWEMEVPYSLAVNSPSTDWNIYGYSDSTKVRFTLWRNPAIDDFPEETLTIKYYIFREDLSLL